MQHRKLTRFAVILIAALFLALTGCSQQAAVTSTTTTLATTTESTTAADITQTLAVESSDGETIILNQTPEKVVILPVWAAEISLELAKEGQIVGLSSYMDQPAITAASNKAATVENRVSMAETEKIIGLKPDLVIIDSFSDYDGAFTKTLRDAGVAVISLTSPTDFTQIQGNITVLAEILGNTEKGASMNADIKARLDAVSDMVKAIPQQDRVKVMYYEDYYDATGTSAGMLCAYGAGSPFDAIAQAAGAVNVCDAENYSPVSKEKVVAQWKPDVLIVPGIYYDENFQAVEDQGAGIKAAIAKDAVLASLPAVAGGRIETIEEKYRGSTSQYMVTAVEQLAKICYPAAFQ